MRALSIRVVAYLAVCALPAVAQPTLMSREMSHVEVSVGAGVMERGPGVALEKQMTALGLESRWGPYTYPYTEPPNILPGAFAQVNIGMTTHTMAGVLADVLETTTYGRTPDGGSLGARANVKTRALLVSFRPTPWVKVEAGPALMHRLFEFESTRLTLRDDAIGWIAGADAKFARRPMTPEHPPWFGYFTAQYRGAPALAVPATVVPLYGSGRLLGWPAQRVRMAHLMLGVGFGFEI